MSPLESDLNDANTLIQHFKLDEAQSLLASILGNETASSNVRADAYYLLGLSVEIDPSRGLEDECGLSFYRQALAENPDHLWANYAIVSTYGLSPPQHQNFELFCDAVRLLSNRSAELDSDVVKFVAERWNECGVPDGEKRVRS
jgi:hypothetical protein